MPPELPGFAAETFTHGGRERTVYRAGSGPAVLVLAEMPGITPRVMAFASRIAAAGFTAVLPNMFGVAGQPPTALNYLRTSVRTCVSRDFYLFATRRNAPVIEWLRQLARHEHTRCGGPGVGVVGMCFTGGYALALAADETVLAPVLSQPSLPVGVDATRRSDLGVDDATLAAVKQRCAADDLCVLGLRFTGDKIAPGARFARLRKELGDSFVGVEIDSSAGNEFGIRSAAHSVLTEDLVDQPGHPTSDALAQVLELLRTRLLLADPTR